MRQQQSIAQRGFKMRGCCTQTDVTQFEVDGGMAVIWKHWPHLAETIFCFSFAPTAHLCVCQTPALHHCRILLESGRRPLVMVIGL